MFLAFPASSVNPRPGPNGAPTLETTTPTSMDPRTRSQTSLVPGRSVTPNPSPSPGLSGVKPSVTITPLPGPSVSPRPGGSGVPTSVTTMPTSTLLRTPFPDFLDSNVNLPPNPRPGPSGAPTSETTTPTNTDLQTHFRTFPVHGRSVSPNPSPGLSGVRTSVITTPTSTLPQILSQGFPTTKSEYVFSHLSTVIDDPDRLTSSSL